MAWLLLSLMASTVMAQQPDVVTVMSKELTDIPGHGFGVAAVQAGIPLNLVQRWLGHAQLSTTAIYAEAIGPEEQEIAARMWT
jgi:site-specific recombinase XerD